ncbi:insulinase family protein [Erythrobacter sp. 3-20A1M]|uniref:M16 family metallopeptidase n=1 Tax=Erythrobacter sp. 3-20A1M TaxID=2653850 RepID=UPI001BFC792D|nr:insulinase family protein [Erythrobacter sp. 3-20A1M]QWC56347.1 insulinase family protein [Erythrobacter sp. 3-20A1M]
MSLTSLRRRSAIALLPLFALTTTAYAAVDNGAAVAEKAAPAQAQQAPAPAPAPATSQQTVTGETPWNFPIYDIPIDQDVIYGTLDNGMKYAILHNETPKNTVALRMRFGFGSIAESDEEQGLAHFIEHMAFNGSKNVPEGEMIKLLERKGLAFGADTNASTGFDATMYKLDLPQNNADLLDTGLMLFRETASNLTIAPEAVDRERGVVLSEMRTRDSFGLRQAKQNLQFELPGAPFGTRLPIGTADVLKNATASEIRSLYERYYQPENAVLVVVGDIDPKMVEPEIRKYFADWKPEVAAGAPLDRGSVDTNRKTEADIFVDPAVPYAVSIDRISDYSFRPTSVASLRQQLLENLGASIVSRRIQKIAQQPDAMIVGGGAGISSILQGADTASISLTAKEGQWEDALRIGEQELRRAKEYGFTQAELNEQLANTETSFRQAAEQQGTRRSAGLAESIANTVGEDDLFVTPAAFLAAFEQIKPTLTVDAVNAAFASGYASDNPLIFVSSKEPVDGGTDHVLSVYREAQGTPVSAPEDKAVAEFGYTDFGTPGNIASDSTIQDLGIRTIRFGNNVMLNLKQTDFEDGRLRFTVNIGRGVLSLPADEPGLPIYMGAMYAQGGLGKHSYDELQTILAGKDVSAGISPSLDAFQISGSTKMADFERQMELSTAYLTDPGYRPEMEARWQGIVPLFEAQLKSTPQQVAAANVDRILADGDQRFGIPDEATLLSRNTQELKSALSKVLANAPIEISVVGDFDPQQVISDVAETFGALPERKANFTPTSSYAGVSFPADKSEVTLYHEGTPDQGLAIVDWPTTDDGDAREEAVLNMLAQVMQLELTEEIREKLGASYSPNAFSTMSDTFKGYGYLGVQIVIAPDTRDEVYKAVDTITKSLRDAPIDADTLQRARAPVMEQIDKSLRENGYWLGVASHAQSEAARLERYRTRKERYASVTAADIQAAAKKYLQQGAEKRISVIHESLRGE